MTKMCSIFSFLFKALSALTEALLIHAISYWKHATDTMDQLRKSKFVRLQKPNFCDLDE